MLNDDGFWAITRRAKRWAVQAGWCLPTRRKMPLATAGGSLSPTYRRSEGPWGAGTATSLAGLNRGGSAARARRARY